jgi:hypothetical protein
VRLPEATRAWSQKFGPILDFKKCAVCVVEPAAVTVLAASYDTVRASVTHMRESVDGLSRWLTDAFEENWWKPEALFLVGARGDLELISGSLEEALSIPVDASDDTQLALARGAALALPSKTEAFAEQVVEEPVGDAPTHRRFRVGPQARAGTVLVAGVIALFVVGPELAGYDGSRSTANRPAANSSPTSISSATSNSSATSASVHAVPSPAVSPTSAQVRPLAAPPPPPPAPPEALPATDAVSSPEPDASDEPVTAAPVEASPAPVAARPVVAAQAPVAAQPVAAPPAPVAAQPAAAPPPFALPPWLLPPPAQAPPAPAAAQPVAAPPAPAAAQPALAAPAPAAPPPPEPSPAPTPAPPPDPIAQVLSPFFGALP